MNIRLIPAPLFIEFEEDNDNQEFKDEYAKLGAEIDDPVGQYIKMAKARGETRDTDKVVMELVVALHRKVDELTKLIKNEEKELIELKHTAKITHIGFEHFKIKEKLFTPNQKYYGRLNIAFFPQREVPLYFIAIDEQTAEILIMHDRDIKDYNAFITARERAIIREQKGMK
jgi:hypothetical protein